MISVSNSLTRPTIRYDYLSYAGWGADIVETLSIIFKDEDAEWISCFCWDLDFGRRYGPGCAKEPNGTSIPLSTTKELYDLLIKNMEESKE